MSVHGSDSEKSSTSPGAPLRVDFAAIRRARSIVTAREEHDPEVLHDALRDLLAQYDTLAGRLAIMSVGGFDD